MVERLISKEIPHGPINIAFTPDEEIGSGADYFDVKRFDADFAYTLDEPRVRSSLKILMPAKLSLRSLVLMYILVLRRIQ